MGNFGISAVRWNSGRTEITECMVHRLTRTGELYAYDEAQRMACSDVVDLIGHDYQVWVMATGARDTYDFKESVQVRGDQGEQLYSTPQNSLYGLPEF